MSGLSSDPGQLTAGVWVARTAVGPLVSRLDCLEKKSFTPWSSPTSAHMVQSPVLVLGAPRVGPLARAKPKPKSNLFESMFRSRF